MTGFIWTRVDPEIYQGYQVETRKGAFFYNFYSYAYLYVLFFFVPLIPFEVCHLFIEFTSPAT
jgi:hypothetical protein